MVTVTDFQTYKERLIQKNFATPLTDMATQMTVIYLVPEGKELFIDSIDYYCANQNNGAGVPFSVNVYDQPLPGTFIPCQKWTNQLYSGETFFLHWVGAATFDTAHRHYWPPVWVDSGIYVVAVYSNNNARVIIHGWEHTKS